MTDTTNTHADHQAHSTQRPRNVPPERARPLVAQPSKDSTRTQTAMTIKTSTPNPDLASLDRLVGIWQVAGDAEGQVRYEWAEGGFFLVQHFDLLHGGRAIKGIEVIGHLHPLDGAPSKEIWTRVYSYVDGLTLDYVYELLDNTLTIWGGFKGSPAFYKGTFSADGRTVTGGWQWPGGGYTANMTRIS